VTRIVTNKKCEGCIAYQYDEEFGDICIAPMCEKEYDYDSETRSWCSKVNVSKKKWKAPKIKHNKLTKWNWMVAYPKKLQLGKNTDIGAFTYIQAEYGVIIEDECEIGSHVSIYSHNTINEKIPGNVLTKGKVHLKRGCCIGSHSIILPGVVVEEKQLIKAHSLLYTKT